MRLAEIMEKTGTTHLELAKAIGVGRSTVSHYIAKTYGIIAIIDTFPGNA